MFSQKVSAILTAIRARAAAYTAAADAIEAEAASCKAARQHATDRIAAAVLVITAEADMMTGDGQDAVFNAILDTAVGTLGTVADQPAETPDVAVSPAKPARKRGKSKTEPSADFAAFTADIASRASAALVIAAGGSVRVVIPDGSVIDHGYTTVDVLASALQSHGLTVYHDYPSWDARPVA